MSRTIPLPMPVMGVDMLSNETALPKGAVRSAVNVDIDREGRFRRRDGYTQLTSSADAHSLFYAPQSRAAFVVLGAKLYRFDPATSALTEVAQLRSADPVSYTEYNGNLYFSNKTTFGWIPAGETAVRPVGVPVPTPPQLTAGPGGLPPGKYAVSITLVDDRGEESGASEVGFITLTGASAGIQLIGLPNRLNWQVYAYITTADGDILQYSDGFAAVFPTYLVSEPPRGGTLDTQFLRPLPAGDIIRWHNGRLLVASGAALYFSEPMRPHLYNPAHNVIPFSGNITLMESVGSGVFVGDDRGVWFLDGTDPSKFELRRVSTCRAVSGSGLMVPPEQFSPKQVESHMPVAAWLSTSGYVVGLPDGNAVELHPDRIRIPNGLAGRTTFLFRSGLRQLVTPVRRL